VNDSPQRKTIARSLGEFFGHIVQGVKTDAAATPASREVNRTVHEEDKGDVILRRTVIDEVELKDTSRQEPPRHADE
jgi:hypothetical protein